MSGALTVWLQPKNSLWPIVGNDEPKNEAPDMSQPSSLCTWPSYHCPVPKNGWCGLMNSIAWPETLLAAVTAHMFEPCIDASNLNASILLSGLLARAAPAAWGSVTVLISSV